MCWFNQLIGPRTQAYRRPFPQNIQNSNCVCTCVCVCGGGKGGSNSIHPSPSSAHALRKLSGRCLIFWFKPIKKKYVFNFLNYNPNRPLCILFHFGNWSQLVRCRLYQFDMSMMMWLKSMRFMFKRDNTQRKKWQHTDSGFPSWFATKADACCRKSPGTLSFGKLVYTAKVGMFNDYFPLVRFYIAYIIQYFW